MLSATSDAEQSTRSATVSALLARRPVKRARAEETETQLQESCVNLLMRHQNTSQLLLEITLRRRSEQTGVPVGLLSARVLLENIEDLITQMDTNTEQVLLDAKQRTGVCALLKSAQALVSAGVLGPELLWQEYWKLQPVLEVIYHLHTHNILTLDFMLERDAAVSAWITRQLEALCACVKTAADDRQIRRQILSTVVCVLVRRAFEDSGHKLSQTCCVILDSMISWLLDSLSDTGTETSAADFWVQVFDVSLFDGDRVPEDTLRRFFTHSLMRVLTYRPVYKVSDVIAIQSEWSFAKTPTLLTALFCKLLQVLETHEVNWRHILSCLCHLLIYHSQTQSCLTDLLSGLLRSAFDGYDVEKMITLFLLARQASLEGPAVFPSYSDWFKLSFGGSSSYHAKSKKSTVFLLKFLSDLVPYEPPQYLKVHVMHPPFIGGKYRSLLQEYVTLAKTRLRDLKVSLEETGIFEVVNGSAGAVECPAQQDVEKAITLFMTTNKIPATVIEASIFRRPYFLSRFLPALLSPRVVTGLILQNFCLCLLDASKVNPPNRQGSWPSVFAKVLLGHRWLLSAVIHRLWDLLRFQGSALSAAHVLGLAALQVELHYCRHACPPVRLTGSSAAALSVSECLSEALICSTRSHMAFCLRFCVAVLSYGLCRANAQEEELHHFIPERLYKKAQYVTARLIAETRAHASDEDESDPRGDGTDLTGTLQDSAVALWRNAQMRSLRNRPRYQLSFSEWLSSELHVQRSQDALTDAERQEYEQWACEQYYLPMSQRDGGCEGDVSRTCALIVAAVLDRHAASRTGGSSLEHTDGCLPDLLSVLQALLYEVALTRQNASEETGRFLWDVIDDRCAATPDPDGIGAELNCQQTLRDVSRVLVLLPPVMLLSVTTDRTGRRTPDCRRMIRHIGHVQRTCGPAGLLSFKLTAHFLKAVVSGGASCDRPEDAVNACVSLFNTECPLLTLSAARWWTRLSAVLISQWRRLTGRDALPDQLQMLEDGHRWSARASEGRVSPVPSAPSWLLAACLRPVLRTSDGETENVRRLVLLFLFVFSVMELICARLNEQAAGCLRRVRDVSVCLLAHLLDDCDWLLLFDRSGSDHRLTHFLSRVASPQTLRLMPFAFYSILGGAESEVLTGAVRSPGFLYSAAVSYGELSRLFLNAHPSDGPEQQVLLEARRVLMSGIALSSPDCLTLSQRRQVHTHTHTHTLTHTTGRLQSEYEQLDSEIAAALGGFGGTRFT
ncbi:Fanconi anemia group A isoform X1 [Labeo rohita]|uniref:Fanconi anemia group A isoform X1 n=1 Tax=Labeo rohita TaxID=84645 RepID=A0A498M6V4_LABRO|nr:Fanconi anemia group A isoform X1 [Labeo rohita]